MGNGFLDDLPDLGISSAKRRKKKKKVDQKQAVRYPAVVRYTKVKCPHCHSERTQVYSHKKGSPIRYHKCLERNCGFRFKSVEV